MLPVQPLVKKIVRRAEHRRLVAAVGVSVLLHLCLLLVRAPDGAMSPTVAPPSPQRFVKRLPPSPRPLARRLLHRSVQRPLNRRPSTRSAPVAALAPAPLTTRRQALQGVPVPLVLGLPPPPDMSMQPLLAWATPHISPSFHAVYVQGTRTGSERIDMSLELLDVDALDTGRYRAAVVVDPQDRRKLKGFLYLSGVSSPSIERAELESPIPRRFWNERPKGIPRREGERQSLQGLADRMAEQTQVRVEVLDEIPLDDPALLHVPFVLLTAMNHFAVSRSEAANLGRYLLSGGFLYIENAYLARSIGNGSTSDLPALRELVRLAFQQVGCREGRDWQFVRLEMSHPLFHCYYDFDTLPLGWWDWTYTYTGPASHFSPEYLEGIQMGGQLVGLYSQKDYADFWAGEAEYIRTTTNIVNERFSIGGEELPVYDLGVNVLVYALTRDGSLAQRLVAAE